MIEVHRFELRCKRVHCPKDRVQPDFQTQQSHQAKPWCYCRLGLASWRWERSYYSLGVHFPVLNPKTDETGWVRSEFVSVWARRCDHDYCVGPPSWICFRCTVAFMFFFKNVYCQRRTHLWFSVRNWNPDNSLMISRSHYNLNEGENCWFIPAPLKIFKTLFESFLLTSPQGQGPTNWAITWTKPSKQSLSRAHDLQPSPPGNFVCLFIFQNVTKVYIFVWNYNKRRLRMLLAIKLSEGFWEF